MGEKQGVFLKIQMLVTLKLPGKPQKNIFTVWTTKT